MSGGANAIDGGVVVSLEKMTAIREVNPQRQYAVAEAGVLNAGLGRAAASAGMFYPLILAAWRSARSGATWPPMPAACGVSNTG